MHGLKTSLPVILIALLTNAGCGDDGGPTQPPPPPGGSPVTVSASKDNTLYEDADGLLSNGAGSFFFVGVTDPNGASGEPAERRRAVIAFDVAASSIPAGSTVDSVFLVLNMNKTKAGATAVKLHRLLADWGESTSAPLNPNEGGGDSADMGDATWLHRFFDTDDWATPGGDFSPAASDSEFVASNGDYTWGSTPEMVAEVQDWLDNPAGNFGWILVGDESTVITAKRFASRTHPTQSARPRLIVHFTKP